MSAKDRIIFEFPVLWQGWECDDDGWVMERPNGTRYLRMTNHGMYVEESKSLEALHERIAAYEIALAKSHEALALLKTAT